jgi:hypothetical protein
VYTDPPGAALSSVLCLKVVAGDGYMYGNTGSTECDEKNNVQKVVWANIPQGDVILTVEVREIRPVGGNTTNDQDFSLAWYIEYGPPKDQRLQSTFRLWNLCRPSKEAMEQAIRYQYTQPPFDSRPDPVSSSLSK